MVKIKSSTGGMVNVEIKGVAQAIAFIRRKGLDVINGSDAGVFQAANFVQQEVQESIIGNRPEPKSVDTGLFGNSIVVDKIETSQYKVFPEKKKYPGTSTTTQDVAKILEFGTSRLNARRHFRNTEFRTKNKIGEIIEKNIKSI